MGIPNYVPDQGAINGAYPTQTSSPTNGFVGAKGLPPPGYYWDNGVLKETPEHQANRLQAEQLYNRDKGLLNRSAQIATPTDQAAALQASRQRQIGALGNLQNQAMGQGPSAAFQMQRGMQGQGLLGALGAMGGGGMQNRAAMGAGSNGLQNAYLQGSQAAGAEQNAGIQGWAQGLGQLRGGDLSEQGAWQQQLERDRKLQLNNAQTNWEAVKGYENLDADRQARLRNASLQAWQDFYKKQGQSDQSNSEDTAATMQAFMSMAAMMMSDERKKLAVKKGRR